jgi:peptidoglycan hydrolase CwlO-like protein
MRRWIGASVAAALAMTSATAPSFAGPALPAAETAETAAPAAETTAVTDGTSSYVQQGLTIHELDKELTRLKAEQADVDVSIGEQQGKIEKQRLVLDERTAASGKVLRAYYMGQRDQLWMLLFKMRSLSEGLLILDYLQAIVRNDFRILDEYRTAYKEQQALLADLSARQERLRLVIAEHERQRTRLTEEQAELDRRLAELTNQEREKQLAAIEAATKSWEEEGVPLFEDVLTALSAAMQDLPELLADPSLMSVSGASMEIRLTDEAFNTFLRERNAMFEDFDFGFGPSGMTVTGGIEDRTASLQGIYILETEPANALRFRIDSVAFNGYELPDTTRAELQDRYDLSFEPGRLVAGLTVSELENEEGLLRVKLSFSFADRS